MIIIKWISKILIPIACPYKKKKLDPKIFVGRVKQVDIYTRTYLNPMP